MRYFCYDSFSYFSDMLYGHFSYLRYTTKHEQVYGSDILTVLSPWAGDVKLFGANWGQLTKDLWDYAHTHTHRSLSLARSLSLYL